MEILDKDLILQRIPLFADLSKEELDIIQGRSQIAEYKKNQLIYEEGAPADAFYCIVLGRAVVYTRDNAGKETILEYLHRGKYFGIISLLTDENHSVTAKAINDSTLLVVKKDDFSVILQKIPKLAIDLSQTLSRRLKNKDIHQKTVFETIVTSVFSSYSQAGKTVYALNFVLGLYKETHKSLVILEICAKDNQHSLPLKLDIDEYKVFDLSSSSANLNAIKEFILKSRFYIDAAFFSYNPEDESAAKKLVAIFTLLVNDYNYIILDLPSSMDEFVLSVLNQSDAIHILTSPESVDLKRTHNLVERLKTDFHFQDAKIKVIINEYRFSRLNSCQQMEMLERGIFATLPKIEFKTDDRLVLDAPDSEYAKVIRRISRQTAEHLVGLALGVGVAYGFCHIGVLKVIEEEKIPVDVISGSSIGSIIASLWALGRTAEEILEISAEFKQPRYIWGLIDLTLPFLGFIKGNKLYGFLKRHFGNKTFYDVRLPLKIVASDVKQKIPIVIEKGLLADAIMASCCMPGVFRPFRFKEDILFDGGVIHPLPTEPLFMMGVKKIIAVNVTPSRQDVIVQRERLEKELSLAPKHRVTGFWLNPGDYFRQRLKTNILDYIFSSIEFMQSELAEKEAQLADIVLHPDTQGMHWMELNKAKEFAGRGEEEARRNLDKIWKVVNE